MMYKRAQSFVAEAGTLIAPWLAILWMMREALTTRTTHLWGPEDPWANNDWVGNLWMWWRTAEAGKGVEWNSQIVWPTGGGDLNAVFPNRVDAWIAAPWADVEQLARWWNGQALLHIGLTALSIALILRLSGRSRLATVLAATYALSSPIWLHELAGGRMATFVVWPGLLSLAVVIAETTSQKTRLAASAVGGALCALQFLAYPFYGLCTAMTCTAVVLTRKVPVRERLMHVLVMGVVCAVICLPTLLTWTQAFESTDSMPPPAGYTSLSIQGALGFSDLPGRFQVAPGFLLLVLAGLLLPSARIWVVITALVTGFALGPSVLWAPGISSGLHGPMHILNEASDTLRRMHHPIRLMPFALATGAVAIAHLIDRARKQMPSRWATLIGFFPLIVLTASPTLKDGISWEGAPIPEGAEGARFVANRAGPVAHITPREHGGLAHQLWHRRPVLASTQGFAFPPDKQPSDKQRALTRSVLSIRAGTAISASIATLQAAGVKTLLLTANASPEGQAFLAERRASLLPVLGTPRFVDDTAIVFALDPS